MHFDIATVINLVAQSLPLSKWGFQESAKEDLYVIYNSQACRLKFSIEQDRTHDNLSVYYGRLHALDNSWTMIWNGENCACRHNHADLQLALEYLDDVPPDVAYERRLAPLKLFQDFHNSEFAKSIGSGEERTLRLHGFIWEHYGMRFFELFDLRNSDLWENYLKFLEEFYKLHYDKMDIAYKRMGQVRIPDDPLLHKKC